MFSWGSLVAYAGTGRPPFGTGGVPEVAYRVINHAPRLDGLDERVRPLVERALDKDPARRPTAQQLFDTLLGRPRVPVAAATQAVSETWTPVVVPPAGPPRPRAPAASGRLWPTVAVGVLAAVLGAAVTLAGALDRTVSQVSLIPPGVGDALYPAVDGGACRCASLPAAPFNGGDRLQPWAVYEGLPEDADRVDVSLGPLGLIKDLAVEQA